MCYCQMSQRLNNSQQIRQDSDPMRLRASLRQHAAHNLQGEIVHSRFLGDECIQDLPAVIDLLPDRETRYPAHECGRWIQLGRAGRPRVATAAPVDGAQQGRQRFPLIGCRRPKEKCPKREGKCVNPGFDTRSAFQIARIGAACSRLRRKSVNRPTVPTPAK